MNFKSVFLCVVFSFILTNIFAQNVKENIWDGKLMFKLNDNINLVIKSLEEGENPKECQQVLNILKKYETTEIKRPFKVLDTPYFDRLYKIKFLQIDKVDEIARELSKLEIIDIVELLPIERKTYLPNDPSSEPATQYALTLIDAPEAWDFHKGGESVVAIIDDAVRIDHEDLVGNLWVNPNEIPNNGLDDDQNGYVDDVNGYDLADGDGNPSPPSTAGDFEFSHGTHCAGIAGATTDNGIGIASIGFNTKIMGIKSNADDSNGSSIEYGWEGISYAIAAGADVISLSWGYLGPPVQSYQQIINTANSQGIVVVSSAGNDDSSDPHYPSDYDYVISVANTNAGDGKNSSSNYSASVDISAPGTNIYSTVATTTSSYVNYTGTSMSCPMVAGLCALIKSFNPGLTPLEIENCIKSSADNIDAFNPGYIGQLGTGRINAQQALICAAPEGPLLAISTSAEGGTCPGEVQITDETLLDPYEWTWTFPGGSPETSNEQNPIVYYATSGIYDITLEATNQYGTATQVYQGAVVIAEDQISEIFYDGFEDGNSSGWEIQNYEGGTTWNVVENQTPYNENYCLTINNCNDNSDGARDAIISPLINMYGRSNASLELTYAYRAKVGEETDSLIISVSDDGGLTYPHTIFAGAEDGSYNVATYFLLNGCFTPSLETEWCGFGTDGADCLSLDLTPYIANGDIRIKIENHSKSGNNFYIDQVRVVGDCVSNSVAPLAEFSAQRFGCDNLETQFTDASIGASTSWLWSFPEGTPSSSIERNPIVSYNTPGSYEVSLTATNVIGSTTTTKTDYIVVSDQNPIANFDLVEQWGLATFMNQSENGVEYHWDFGDGVTSTEANPVYDYGDDIGNYTVILSVTNGCGTDTHSIVIETTSIQNPFGENTSLNIYPNPNNGYFTIEVKGKDYSNANISVYDILGREVFQSRYQLDTKNWTKDIDLINQPVGTYIIKIDIEGQSSHKKIVIR